MRSVLSALLRFLCSYSAGLLAFGEFAYCLQSGIGHIGRMGPIEDGVGDMERGGRNMHGQYAGNIYAYNTFYYSLMMGAKRPEN